MPIRAPTMKATCRRCGKQRLWPQRSDALIVPRECAACCSQDVSITVAKPFDIFADAVWCFGRLIGSKREYKK